MASIIGVDPGLAWGRWWKQVKGFSLLSIAFTISRIDDFRLTERDHKNIMENLFLTGYAGIRRKAVLKITDRVRIYFL
jgi:hypothetical protein